MGSPLKCAGTNEISGRRRGLPVSALISRAIADDAVPIRAVGSDFKVIDHIAPGAPEIFGERLAHDGVLAENQQTVHLIGEAEFLRGTKHAMRFNAANLADL